MNNLGGLQSLQGSWLTRMGLRTGHAADSSAHKLRASYRHYGKTGAGKSSLCNALFAGEVSPVSDVAACTREPLRFRLQVGERYTWWTGVGKVVHAILSMLRCTANNFPARPGTVAD
jgi:hypothetical protein